MVHVSKIIQISKECKKIADFTRVATASRILVQMEWDTDVDMSWYLSQQA